MQPLDTNKNVKKTFKIDKVIYVYRNEGVYGLFKRLFYRIGMLFPDFVVLRMVPVLRNNRVWVFYKNYKTINNLNETIKLHLGCGSVYLDGYVNIDIEDWSGCCDMVSSATSLKMFRSNNVDHVYNHAVLEHIPPWDTIPALSEWFRVLKPGGTIQIEVPDLQRVFEDWFLYGTLSEDEAINNIYGGFKVPNKNYKAQDHLTGFTFDRLSRLMEQVGYEQVSRMEHGTYHHILVVHARKPFVKC